MRHSKENFVFDSDIITKVTNRSSFTRAEVSGVYGHVIKCIVECIEDGKHVKIRDLGRIEIRYMAPRKAMDLVHKCKVDVCAKNKAVFIPCSRLKDILEYGLKLLGRDYSTRLTIPSARRKMVTRLEKWLRKRDEQDERVDTEGDEECQQNLTDVSET